MDDVRERLRREIDRLEPSPEGFEKTIRRVRARQRMRRAGAATIGLTLTALLVVGLWTLVEAGRRPEPGPASTGTLVGGLAFADGQLLRFTAGGTEVVATLPEQIAPEPPVLARSGVLVLTGRPSVGLRLWLVSPNGSVNQIAEDVTDGFAVDPAGDVVAYATTSPVQSPPYHSTVHIVSLSDGSEVSTSHELDFYAAVRGIADGNVVLSTGDGASASVGLWVPDTDQIRQYPMYGNAEGTDPVTGVSVLNVGDGQLPILVRFREGPTDDLGIIPGEIVVDPTVVQLDGVDFAPGGGRVAGIQQTSSGVELIVLDDTSGQVAFRAPLPGGSQTAWSGDDTILVLDKGEPAARVHRCDLTTGECAAAERDLPSAGRFGYGLWLVTGSFEAGSRSDGEQVSPSMASTTRCSHATTSGDFDGDGTTDEAEFIQVVAGDVSCNRGGEVFENLTSQEIHIRFGSGQTVEQAFNDCKDGLCAYVFEATDLDGDGRDELAVDVSGCGAMCFVEFYGVEDDGIRSLVIAEPGDPPFVEPGPAILGGSFDSVAQSPLVCRVNEDGTRELVSIHAGNIGDSLSGPWRVHTSTIVLQGDRLVVTSTDDSESSFPDTTGIPSFSKASPFENGCS